MNYRRTGQEVNHYPGMLENVRRETEFSQQSARPSPGHLVYAPALGARSLNPSENAYGSAAVVTCKGTVPKHDYHQCPDHVDYDQPRHTPEMRRLHLRMQSGNTVMNLPMPPSRVAGQSENAGFNI